MLLELFGWTELIITFSFEEQVRIRSALADHGIPYKLKTVNRASPFAPSRRAYTGSLGEQQSLSYEYLFYVKEQDLDAARGALHTGR